MTSGIARSADFRRRIRGNQGGERGCIAFTINIDQNAPKRSGKISSPP
jgi:hypothetical protein